MWDTVNTFWCEICHAYRYGKPVKLLVPDAVASAIQRLIQVRANIRENELCWNSKVYDPIWTGKPHESTWNRDLQLVAYHFIDEMVEP